MRLIKTSILLVILLILLACSVTVNVPTVDTGVTQTLEINEPAGDASNTAELNITMGAGSLTLAGGSSSLVEGTVLYNVEAWKPVITRDGSDVSITQRTSGNVGLPSGNIKNSWDLKVGSGPLEFSLTTGAYEGDLDLTGVAVTRMTVTDGASKSAIDFKSINPVEMSSLQYKTGASEVILTGLGYANVREIIFESGVGAYTLDFSGGIQKETNLVINSGMSDIKVIIPLGTNVQVEVAGGLSNVDARGTWTIGANTYTSPGNGPLLTVKVNMAVGNLQLIQE